MSVSSFSKTFNPTSGVHSTLDLPVGPGDDESPVGPHVPPVSRLDESMDQVVGPEIEKTENNTLATENLFTKTRQKRFPLTRWLFTRSVNGSLSQLSAVKKVFVVIVGSIMSLLTFWMGIGVALRNRVIENFNDKPVEERMKALFQQRLTKVIDAAKAYHQSPDKHEVKQELAKANQELGQMLDEVLLTFPEEADELERAVREKVHAELGALEISIKPHSSQDLHRFTYPLTRLVLDGFYPVVNDMPNPYMKGVTADSIAYQFEDGIFSLSQDRIINLFLKQSATNLKQAVNDLQENLQKIQKPTKQGTEAARDAVMNAIADKLRNPASPEFQEFVTGALAQADLQIGPGVFKSMSQEELNTLADSLVKANILSEPQAEVFRAQVLNASDQTATEALQEVTDTQNHAKKAKKALVMGVPIGVLSALERFGYEPLKRGGAFLQAHLPQRVLNAVNRCVDAIGKERLATIAPKAVGLGTAALAVYGLYHGYKALTGPQLTPGAMAAQSFASAMEYRKDAFETLRNVELPTNHNPSFENSSESAIHAFQKSVIDAENRVNEAGEALQAVGTNPTPENIAHAADLAEKAHQQYEQVAKQAKLLQDVVEEANKATNVEVAPGMYKTKPLSYIDLDRLFAEAKKAFKRIDKQLDGAQGLSTQGGKKLDELQKELQKKADGLAAFESCDLEKVRPDVERVAALKQQIGSALVSKKANPKKSPRWEKSFLQMDQELTLREERIKEVRRKHEFLKKEIAHLKELISLMGATPQANTESQVVG